MTSLSLPSGHPLARAIMDAGVERNRVLLTVNAIGSSGVRQTLRLEVMQWTRRAGIYDEPERVDIELVDADERDRQMRELAYWPQLDPMSHDLRIDKD